VMDGPGHDWLSLLLVRLSISRLIIGGNRAAKRAAPPAPL